MIGKRLGTGLAIAGAAAAFYFRFARQWHLHWGAPSRRPAARPRATNQCPTRTSWPPARSRSTRRRRRSGPWLVQMGPGRGGAYTYDWIERRLGIDIHNSDRIIPEFQHLRVGDEIPMPGYTMRVERLDPERAMVFRSSNHAWVWSFELRPAAGHTRLISRNRFDTSALPWKDKLAYPVVEPGSWVMERQMLLTIKQRAERLAHAQPPA